MKRKKDKKIKKYYIFLIIIVLVFLSLFLLNKYKFNETKEFKSIKNVSYKGLTLITKPVTNTYKIIKNINKVEELENSLENLKKEKEELLIIKDQNKLLKEEIDSLKNELELKKVYSNYEVEYANIINRNVLYWFNEITINKGSKDGIEEGNAVVTHNGLVGKVIQTTNDTSLVELITSNNNKTSILINDLVGTITSYQDNLLIAEGITNYDKVNINDKVYTSGLATLPKNILIGYVKEIKKDNYDTSKILLITPSQDINNLYFVTILKNKK